MSRRGKRIAGFAIGIALIICTCVQPALAACAFALQGDGRVSRVLDAKTFRLEDGREVRLAGIELAADSTDRGKAMLVARIEGRDVSLYGSDDTPDRYGRQPAFIALKGSATPIQLAMLTGGEALASPTVSDPACSRALLAAEAAARAARRGIWTGSAALKNAESTDDILARLGRFTAVEGTVSSARLAGATFYVNFGRRWTRDFAVTISRRMIASVEAAGIDLKSLKGKRIRVRGWIEKRGGPRIEITHAGQLELIGAARTISGDLAVRELVPEDEGK
ncbi:thermonuclease family protein [Afipia massiliensis]|uniref:Thermonuclease family protein n=1 Tax=Afipia massiliensis TaxID=211460 RepID=A0A4U6BTN3_9BRAD|nr:thermonuclease family protein [Afipia massiliensis]